MEILNATQTSIKKFLYIESGKNVSWFETNIDSILLSYGKILKKLHLHELTTKQDKEIIELDLRKVIDVMLEKHLACRWRSEKIRSRKYFTLIEGDCWLSNVILKKSLIDADIDFLR